MGSLRLSSLFYGVLFGLGSDFGFLALARRGKEESSEIKIRLLKAVYNSCFVQPLRLFRAL